MALANEKQLNICNCAAFFRNSCLFLSSNPPKHQTYQATLTRSANGVVSSCIQSNKSSMETRPPYAAKVRFGLSPEHDSVYEGCSQTGSQKRSPLQKFASFITDALWILFFGGAFLQYLLRFFLQIHLAS